MWDHKFADGRVCHVVEKLSELPPASTFPKRVCFDVETTSFDDSAPAFEAWKGHRIAGYGLAVSPEEAWYIPVRHHEGRPMLRSESGVGHFGEPVMAEGNLDPVDVAEYFRTLFTARPEFEMFGHNVKFDLRFLRQDDVHPTCRIADTMVLARLVDNLLPKVSLEFLLAWYFRDRSKGETADKVKGFLASVEWETPEGKRKKGTQDYGRCPIRLMAPYCANDAMRTYKLRRHLEGELSPDSRELWDVEKLFTRVLSETEFGGVLIDPMRLKRDYHEALKTMAALSETINSVAGWEVDPGSDADKTRLLSDQLGIKPEKFTETGRPKWDKFVLEELEKRIPADAPESTRLIGKTLRAWKRLDHFCSTYFEGWLERVDSEYRLHTDFKQAGTATGRLSSGNPNTQNIPTPAERCIVAPRGYVIAGWDYSQIEYRIFAHYTQDPTIAGAYRERPDMDFHQTLATMLGMPRQFAKSMNFAFLYGMGKKKLLAQIVAALAIMEDKDTAVSKLATYANQSGGLAKALDAGLMGDDKTEELKVLYAVAEGLYDEYHRRFPSIRTFGEKVIKTAKRRRWVKNLFGRVYTFRKGGYHGHALGNGSGHGDEDNDGENNERLAVNYLIQGSSADLVRFKIVELDPVCRRHGARLFMTVHDSVYFYVPRENAPAFYAEAQAILENVPRISVPILTDGSVATTTLSASVKVKSRGLVGEALLASVVDALAAADVNKAHSESIAKIATGQAVAIRH